MRAMDRRRVVMKLMVEVVEKEGSSSSKAKLWKGRVTVARAQVTNLGSVLNENIAPTFSEL